MKIVEYPICGKQERWNEACIAYRAGVHPRQKEITEFLSIFLRKLDELCEALEELENDHE